MRTLYKSVIHVYENCNLFLTIRVSNIKEILFYHIKQMVNIKRVRFTQRCPKLNSTRGKRFKFL
jgi:hypothetical protein